MIDRNLAIIIPAYKADYLAEALQSLSNQTNRQFTVYIGDDCSPFDLKKIVDEFIGKINIVYHRFDQNMGSISLTRQWERCIDLSNEDWVWLFSDDDIIANNAVQVFHNSYSEKNLLYKFHTQVIDEFGHIDLHYQKFDYRNDLSNTISSTDFIRNRLACNGFRSFAVEYVFHRSLYSRFKFIDFPLAWGSDDATWFLYSLYNQNKIDVLNAKVYWRFSGLNISSDAKSLDVIEKKLNASVHYMKWIRNTSEKYGISISESLLLRWFSIQVGCLNPKINYQAFKKLSCDAGIIVISLKLWLSYFRVFKKNRVMTFLKGK